MFDSFEAHKRVADDIANAYSEGYEQGKRDAQQWILCSESPTAKGEYLVTAFDGVKNRLTIVEYGKTQWRLTGARAYWRVIAWMPLPEPYKEDSHETD